MISTIFKYDYYANYGRGILKHYNIRSRNVNSKGWTACSILPSQ